MIVLLVAIFGLILMIVLNVTAGSSSVSHKLSNRLKIIGTLGGWVCFVAALIVAILQGR